MATTPKIPGNMKLSVRGNIPGMMTIIGSGLMLGWLYEGPRRFLARLKRRCVG